MMMRMILMIRIMIMFDCYGIGNNDNESDDSVHDDDDDNDGARLLHADALISTLLCVVVLAAMAVVGLLVYTGFLCLRGGPLPSILVSNTSDGFLQFKKVSAECYKKCVYILIGGGGFGESSVYTRTFIVSNIFCLTQTKSEDVSSAELLNSSPVALRVTAAQ